MPAAPTWLRRVPDAIARLEEWPETEVGRGDLERLLRVKKARAVQMMHAWGARRRRGGRGDLVLEKRTLQRQLRALQRGGRVEQEEARAGRVLSELQEARVSRVRVPVDPATLRVKLAGLPEGVVVAPQRIVVEFRSAKEAVARLFAVAQALNNDWDQFEDLVERAAGARTRRDA